jgi:DNA-binding NtrC family response regulator
MNGAGALVYVVDDDVSAREGVARLIRSAGFVAKTFESGEQFLAIPRPHVPSCLILDVNLPGLNGLDLQEKLARSHPPVPIVFLTGHGDIPMTVRAVKAGAANFLTKPVDADALLDAVRHCFDSWLGDEIQSDQTAGNMIGESQALQAILRDIRVVAPTDAAVLIQGETGTGKELVARGIHEMSGRRTRPFVMVNCAAIPATLLESELFGHERGAFTGAVAQKIGRFESAHQGTLFLDEIGEVPLELQPKLLRALQEHEFERLGGTRTTQVDVRIITATNRNLKQMVDEGKFRGDLYYRLHVFPLTVPPLRERREDIPLLIRYFTQRYARRLNRDIEEIPTGAIEALTQYDWPGNIRELQHLVERSVILSPGRVLQIVLPDTVPSAVPEPVHRTNGPLIKGDGSERERILEALRLSGGIVGGAEGAAARLGLRRTTLQSRMKKLRIARQYG